MLKKILATAALVCVVGGMSACAHSHDHSHKDGASCSDCKECKSGHCSTDHKDAKEKCDGHCKGS